MYPTHGIFSCQKLGRPMKLTQIEQVHCAIIQIGCHLNNFFFLKKVILAYIMRA